MAKVQAALLQLRYDDIPVAGSTEQAIRHNNEVCVAFGFRAVPCLRQLVHDTGNSG